MRDAVRDGAVTQHTGDQNFLAGEQWHCGDYTQSVRSALAVLSIGLFTFLAGCGDVWNDPYPAAERGKSIFYTSFINRPKHLDPVQSYTEDEATFTQQVYEPPLQYHYLKRPYELISLTAVDIPKARPIEGGKFILHGHEGTHRGA